MQITNLVPESLPGVVSLEAPMPASQRQRSGSNFDNILSDANRRQAVNEPPASRERVERSSAERRENTETATGQEAAAAYENVQAQAHQEANEYTAEETVYITNQEAPEYAKALQYVAEAAILPTEALKEWLIKENTNLHELQEPEAMPKFVEYALGKKAPAELLTDPVLPEIYKALHEAAELLKAPKEATAQKNVVVAETTKNAAPLIKADINGLEVLKKDGEVIVTDEFDETANQGNNSGANNSGTGTNTASQTATQAAHTIVIMAQGESAAVDAPPVAAMQETSAVQTQQAAEAAKPIATQAPVNAQDVINQIMAQVKVASSGQNFTEMRITLRPESLGEIMLRVITQNGIVMAQFEAESQRIKETLEANFNQLRDALTGAGIAFGELNVFVRQEGEERLNQFERERLAARRRMESILAEEEVDETKDLLHDGILDEVA